MKNRNKQILALRTAYIAGIFSFIVCTVMLLNYWQLVITDPLESELIKTMVENLQDDTSNEELKLEIRNLDLLARNAYFTNQWQIRTGAYLLVVGIVITVIALRIYYSSRAEIIKPEAQESRLDIELLITRKWILYTVSTIFSLAIIASILSIDHLSKSYVFDESTAQKDQVPLQEIIPRQDSEEPSAAFSTDPEAEADDPVKDKTVTTETETESGQTDNLEEKIGIKESTATNKSESVSVAGYDEMIKNFPSFRGPFGLGVSYAKNIPTTWDGKSGKNILWKTYFSLPGLSSPVIWSNLIFITGADASNQSVYCFDAINGKILWEYKVKISRPPGAINPTEDTGFAAPSVAANGSSVFAIFASGDLVCLDLKGNQRWAKNIGLPDNHYGHSSSLLTWQKLLFIQFDTNTTGKVLALDTQTGDQVWETIRTSKISWASPILANIDDHYELILASSPNVSAYDPESGKELWSFSCLSGEVGPSPAFSKGTVFAANEYAKLIAFVPGNPSSVVWENNEYLPEVSSPVAADDLLFIGTSYGVIACYSASTGEIFWEYECNQGFYASPIVADGKVFFLDRGGKMYIFSVDKKLKLINDPELGEGSVSTPAFSDGRIFIRGYDNLYCIGS